MSTYDNEKRGVAFVNEDKKYDKHPDMKGNVTVNGVEYWVAAWWKTPKNGGEDFLSFNLQKKEGKKTATAPKPSTSPARGHPQPKKQEAGGFDDMDDDIPF